MADIFIITIVEIRSDVSLNISFLALYQGETEVEDRPKIEFRITYRLTD